MEQAHERWQAQPSTSSGNYHICDSRGNQLAVVWARTDGQTAKPANLIAASPDLLEALAAALGVINAALLRPGTPEYSEHASDVYKDGKAAVDRAER